MHDLLIISYYPSDEPVKPKAKVILKNKGWSYRAVAPVLGVTPYHLSQVLNGHRESRRLLSAIETLPRRKTPSSTTTPPIVAMGS